MLEYYGTYLSKHTSQHPSLVQTHNKLNKRGQLLTSSLQENAQTPFTGKKILTLP